MPCCAVRHFLSKKFANWPLSKKFGTVRQSSAKIEKAGTFSKTIWTEFWHTIHDSYECQNISRAIWNKHFGICSRFTTCMCLGHAANQPRACKIGNSVKRTFFSSAKRSKKFANCQFVNCQFGDALHN